MKKAELSPSPDLDIPAMPVICHKCRAEGTAGDPMFAGIPDILRFDPVPRRTQVNSWTAEHQRAFIAALAISGSARKAAATIGRHVFGADQLRKVRGGRSFSEAWDAALDVARERELARVYENLSELNADQEAANARGVAVPSGGGYHEEGREPTEEEYDEVQERNRQRLLSARRLLLMMISEEPEKRAAWEVLVGPVDWEKAAECLPQDNEPFPVRMRAPDMVMAAEAGLLHDLIGTGRDLTGEIAEAVEEVRATGETNGPKVRRVCG